MLTTANVVLCAKHS